ncbi:hypothetical protein [uncultured Roseobacter sp.]|uniref:hypothetical protein n=1 Tax=uncultured Roseobacter sp. TaxID=114847 RepID=UPI002603814D|nr:hypothetical protein [uncultured Roseobacter sp.]
MADYTTQTNDGVSGKGIFIALVVIGAFIFLLAIVGTSSVPPGEGDATAPAAIESAPAEPAAPAVIE